MGVLNGQIAWITGGSGEIGNAMVKVLSGAGAKVVVGYYKSKKQAHEVAAQYDAYPSYLDVTQASSVQESFQDICNTVGTPSILIHAAGISKVGLFQDHAEEDYDEMMDVHVKGAFHVIHQVLPSLIRKRNGRIILISSIWGELGGAGEVLYSAAKGAQHAMVKALAKELASSGITVNAVAPGAINTRMCTSMLSEADLSYLTEEIPVRRLGEPDEVASLVHYLCQKEAAYITGQVLHVSGGWHT